MKAGYRLAWGRATPPLIPVEKLAAVGGAHPKLGLLPLFGSRARGDARDDSDWDVGYLADAGMAMR